MTTTKTKRTIQKEQSKKEQFKIRAATRASLTWGAATLVLAKDHNNALGEYVDIHNGRQGRSQYLKIENAAGAVNYFYFSHTFYSWCELKIGRLPFLLRS